MTIRRRSKQSLMLYIFAFASIFLNIYFGYMLLNDAKVIKNNELITKSFQMLTLEVKLEIGSFRNYTKNLFNQCEFQRQRLYLKLEQLENKLQEKKHEFQNQRQQTSTNFNKGESHEEVRKKDEEIKQKHENQPQKDEKHTPQEGRCEFKLLITSIGRSGSDLIGELFKRHSKVSYYFEPLEKLNETFESQQFINKRALQRKLKDNAFAALDKLLYPTVDQNECKNVVLDVRETKLPGGLLAVTSYYKQNTIKFLQLVRDPRAVFFSMMELNWFNKAHLKIESKRYCGIIYEDMRYASTYASDNSFEIIRYEDFCHSFKKYSDYLLSYSELPQDEEYDQHVEKLLGQQAKDKKVSKIKASVTEWRETVEIETVRIIEEQCKNVMLKLSYILVDSDVDLLRDITKPLY